MIDLKKHLIHVNSNLISALKQLNSVPKNLTLFVLDDNQKLIGTLTDGDIRRGLINGKKIDDTIDCFMTRQFSALKGENCNVDEIREIKQKGVKLLPILDNDDKVSRVIDFNTVKTQLPIDAVLMAGGRGERLRPLTDKTPKPLLKVGEKPIIEHNIDHLIAYGIYNLYITIRYLGEQIEDYFGNGNIKGVSISYIKETIPLGTIGAISHIKEFKHDHILVMNSDLFTNINLEDFYKTFYDEDADICIATIPYNIDIPYAIINLKNDVIVTGLQEKPRYTYYANAGIYLIKKELIKEIPTDIKTDATEFILKSLEKGNKVIKYPIIGYWFDIGNSDEYLKVSEIAKHL